LHFSVYSLILFLSIGRATPFLYNDHSNTLESRRLLKTITVTVNVFASATAN